MRAEHVAPFCAGGVAPWTSRWRGVLGRWEGGARRAFAGLALGAIAGIAAAQISVVDVSAPSPPSNAVNTITVAKPAGIVAGDFMLAVIANRGGSSNSITNAPAGWALVTSTLDGNRLGMYVYRKVVGASEPSGYTWTLAATNRTSAAILAFRGVDTSNPIAAFATQVNAASTSMTAPSITPGTANTMLLGLWGIVNGNANITVPSSMAVGFDTLDTGAGPNGIALAGATQADAAATATGTRVATSDIGQNNTGYLIALRPIPFVTSFLVEAAGGGSIGAQVAGYPFAIRLTALDGNNSVVTSFTGTVTVTSTGTLSQGSGTTLNFVNGVLVSHTVSIGNSGTFTITATGASGATGTSAPFTVSTLGAWLTAEYRMEETGWSGTAGEVSDSSSNGYNGRAVNASTANTTPAVPGSPGTCRYGVFNRSNAYVELPANFPNLTGSFAIAAWIRPTSDVNGDQRIFADDENNGAGFGFSLGDGGSGRLRFFGRAVSPVSLDSTPVITTNRWFFVAAIHDAATKKRTIYAYDASGTALGRWSDTYTGTWGADSGRASIGGETASAGSEAVPRWRFGGNVDELKVYGLALTQAQIETLMGQTHPCAVVTATPGRFNAFETSTAGGATTGVVKTKLAGAAFPLAVVALNATGSAVLTTFTGTVTVALVDARDNSGAIDPATQCRSTWTGVIATVSPSPAFTTTDSGRIDVTVPAVPDAYRDVRVRVTYTSGGTTVTGCSSDNFAIRPSSFAGVQATDGTDTTPGVARALNNASTTAGVVHRAGRPFTVLGAAVSSAGTTTAGYDGTPALSVTTCSVPAGCTAGTLASSIASNSGTLSGTATYSEAGVIAATLSDSTFAAVDAGDSTAAERTITSSPITIGRFVPAAYRLTTAATPTFAPPLCASGPSAQPFVFVGQPFSFGTNPAVLATPINAAGTVLANARPRFGTGMVTSTISAAGAPVTMTGSVTASSVTASSIATIAFTGSSFSFTRGATPVASFTPTIAMTVDVSDTTETATAGNTAIDDEATLTIGPVAFSPVASPFYYGRIQLYPTFGDYRRDLSVPLEVQAWNGLGWMPLTAAGACVSAGATAFAYSQPTGGLAETGGSFTCGTRVAATVTTSNGRAAIALASPAYSATTQPSGVTLTLNLLSSASGTSCSAPNTSTAATTTGLTWLSWPGGSNPTARVTWGRARGDAIYRRERFD